MVFFISEFASKLLVFLILPLYTTYLTAEQFGTADLITTTVTLLMPIFTLCISQAALRFAMEEYTDKRQVFSFGLKVIVVGFTFLLAAYPLFHHIAGIFKYLLLFYLLYLASSLDTYLSYFARAVDQVVLVGVSGIVKTVMLIAFNIVFLIVFKLGVAGYVLSSVLSHAVSCIILFFGARMHQYCWFQKTDKAHKKEMLQYSIPLVPNSLSWWLSNYASRYIILLFCGVGTQGMFAVASKIPVILTTVQAIFSNAWQLSAISEYDKPKRDEFYNKIYKLYNTGMVLFTAALIPLVRLIAKILFVGEFFDAWVYVPLLLISVIFGALSGFLGTFFAASKHNGTMFTTTLLGALCAVAVNLALVPPLGPIGASIATLAANIIVWVMRLVKSKKYVNLDAEIILSCFCYGLLILQAVWMVAFKGWFGYFGAVLILAVLIIINFKYMQYLMSKAWYKVKNRFLKE